MPQESSTVHRTLGPAARVRNHPQGELGRGIARPPLPAVEGAAASAERQVPQVHDLAYVDAVRTGEPTTRRVEGLPLGPRAVPDGASTGGGAWRPPSRGRVRPVRSPPACTTRGASGVTLLHVQRAGARRRAALAAGAGRY